MTRSLVTTRKTSGKTLSAYYRGQRVLFVSKRRHLEFYRRVSELEAVAALAETSLLWSIHALVLKEKRQRLSEWLHDQRALRSGPVVEAIETLSDLEDAAYGRTDKIFERHDRLKDAYRHALEDELPKIEFPYPFNYLPKGSV